MTGPWDPMRRYSQLAEAPAGRPCVHAKLAAEGICVGHKRVTRLICRARCQVLHPTP